MIRVLVKFPKMKRICLAVLALVFIFTFFSMPPLTSVAQSTDDIIYDYVILIDTSASMLDGTPPLFGQVQKVAQDFVTAIQEGSNLTVYSFDSGFKEVGTWKNITLSDKSQINKTIGNMSAVGQMTALWDAVCQGVTRLEQMGQSGGQHIQLIISYTDGKDNFSKNTSTTCLANYQELQKSGFTYWIYNAIGGVAVPQEITDLKDIIGIVDSTNPMPIRVVHIQPLTLDLGNLYQTGKSIPNTSCLVFWASDNNIYGRELSFSQPPTFERKLPSGNAAQICVEGTDCERNLKLSSSKTCLQVELVNYFPQNLNPAETGDYSLTLPLNISFGQPQDQVFLVPNSVRLNFQLNMPPTPTPFPTSTKTPLPTITPLPTTTATPFPPETVIDCGGVREINPGVIRLERDAVVTMRKYTCHLNWKKYTLPQSITIDLQYDDKSKDNKELNNFIWLSKGGALTKTLVLTESDPEFEMVINVPQTEWKFIGNGKQSFIGELHLQPKNTFITGDIDAAELTLPVSYQIKKPASLFFLIGIFGAIAAILLAIVIPKIIESTKTPVFTAVLSYEKNGQPVRINLMNYTPKKLSRNSSQLVFGHASNCDVKLPVDSELGGVYFKLIAERSQGKLEISIIAIEFLKVNNLPIASKKLLKSRDTISLNNVDYHIIISNT